MRNNRLIGLKFSFLLALIILLMGTANAQPIQGDRILAVVGNDIILESDFQYQVQLYARQNQLTEINPALAQQIFQQILTDKIIYAKAVQDSILIDEEEVNKELDYRIKSLTEQLGSIQNIESVYGMSLGRIKLMLKDDLRKRLMSDQLKREKFRGGVKISDKEVRDFFSAYRDSLPEANSEYELSQIYVIRKVSDTEKELARKKAQQILDSINAGVDFSELAIRNSDDPGSGANGGQLGASGRGTFVKPFEDALFSMQEGELSGLIETQFGYHIIKLDKINGSQRISRHILISYPRLESSDQETITFMNDLKGKIERGEITFQEAAFEYTQDEKSKKDSGYVGSIPIDKLDSLELEALANLPNGSITDPIRIGDNVSYGYEILKVRGYKEGHPLNLTDDYDKIKQFALYFKENTEMDEWITELKESIYVDLRL